MKVSLTCSSTATWCTESPRASRALRRSAPGPWMAWLSAIGAYLIELLHLRRGREQLDELLGVILRALLVAERTLGAHAQEQHFRLWLRDLVVAFDEGASLQVF